MACEGKNLNLQLSASLGHSNPVHFPSPSAAPPQSSCRRKSPSQLRRQKGRQDEAIHKAKKAAPAKEAIMKHSEKKLFRVFILLKRLQKYLLSILHTSRLKSQHQSLGLSSVIIVTSLASAEKKLRKHNNQEHRVDNIQDVQLTSTFLSFQCDQCDYIDASDKGPMQHQRMSHRMSQVGGNNNEPDEDFLPGMAKS